MKTITKSKDSVDHAIAWLKEEHPKGVDLIYIDYRDCFEDMNDLQKVLKDGDYEGDWMPDSQYETINYIIGKYTEDNNIDELTDEVRDSMNDWLFENDTSTPVQDLLKNTGDKLCYIETQDYSGSYEDMNKDEWDKQKQELKTKYAIGEKQEKEIDYVLSNQFYGSPVSFYFNVDVEDLYKALHTDAKYITIGGAYFSTIDRVQGSNWLGENAEFNLCIPKAEFIENFYLDKAKGNGYGWDSIAGQTGYDDASIGTSDTQHKDEILILPVTSETLKREQRLQDHWNKTKTCTYGDMNWNRHKGEKPYNNNFPCGNKCETCGTFWID
jgi:hypothetical protein